MKRFIKSALIFLFWAVFGIVLFMFPHLPFALMRWVDEKLPT